MSRTTAVETQEGGEHAIMEARVVEAFAGTEQLTVIGKQLHLGEAAPDFNMDYFDLVDMAVRRVGLADPAETVRLLNMVNSLERPICQLVTRGWEAHCPVLPPLACIYTVGIDSPEMQARCQDSAGVLHQALSAHNSERLCQDYGVWLKEWSLLQRAVFVIDIDDRIVYVEYVADQLREPDYATAMQAVLQAAVES